jgi:chaperonin GroES
MLICLINSSAWETEIRRIVIRSQPGANSSRDPIEKYPNKKGWWRVAAREQSPSCGGPRVMAGKAFRKFLPLFDRVLVERNAAETVTKGGIMLPEKSQGKVLQATVVVVGSGSKGKDGEIQPVSVQVGDKVLLPEYGGTKVVLDDKDYFLFRDGAILGKYVD